MPELSQFVDYATTPILPTEFALQAFTDNASVTVEQALRGITMEAAADDPDAQMLAGTAYLSLKVPPPYVNGDDITVDLSILLSGAHVAATSEIQFGLAGVRPGLATNVTVAALSGGSYNLTSVLEDEEYRAISATFDGTNVQAGDVLTLQVYLNAITDGTTSGNAYITLMIREGVVTWGAA